MTELDRALAAMQADPADEALRLRFYARLADTELVLLLDREAAQGEISPRIFPLDEGPVALAFEGEDRLAEMAGAEAAYAALPGRIIAAGLKGQGVGLGLNLGAEAPSLILPPAALDWLADRLTVAPEATAERPEQFLPSTLTEAALAELGQRLAPAAGALTGSLLVRVRYHSGRTAHLVILPAAPPEVEAALARAVAEAAAFCDPEGEALDAAFLAADDPLRAAIAAQAVTFAATPLPEPAPDPAPKGPGMDPARPPRLV